MGIQIKRVGHVGILVSDFERSFEFYTKVLGCKVTSRRRRPDGAETAFLRFDETHHDFVIAAARRRGRFRERSWAGPAGAAGGL